jgi:hypothetical protein
MFVVNNVGFNCKKAAKVKKNVCRNLLAVAVEGLWSDLMDYLVGKICGVI